MMASFTYKHIKTSYIKYFNLAYCICENLKAVKIDIFKTCNLYEYCSSFWKSQKKFGFSELDN